MQTIDRVPEIGMRASRLRQPLLVVQVSPSSHFLPLAVPTRPDRRDNILSNFASPT